MSKFKFTLYVKNTELEVEIPAKNELCPRCDGEGSHTNPAIDGNGITASEMDELGDDFREDYMQGVYDVTCERCAGAKVIVVPDLKRCSPEQRSQYRAHERAEQQMRREDDSEAWLRRAESGGGW